MELDFVSAISHITLGELDKKDSIDYYPAKTHCHCDHLHHATASPSTDSRPNIIRVPAT
jgi:hypothetical protein